MPLQLKEKEIARLKDHLITSQNISRGVKKSGAGGSTRKKNEKWKKKKGAKYPTKTLIRKDIVCEDGRWVSAFVRCGLVDGRAYVQTGFVEGRATLSLNTVIGEVVA